MKFILILCAVFSFQFSIATELVDSDTKIDFAKRSVDSVLKSRNPQLSVVSDSVKLNPCKGLNKFGAALSNLLQSGKAECHIVEFQAYDKQTQKFFFGRTLLSLEHKVRRKLGVVPEESVIPQLDLVHGETVDKKTGKTVTMGIHAMNSEVTKNQTATELFELLPASRTGDSNSGKATP